MIALIWTIAAITVARCLLTREAAPLRKDPGALTGVDLDPHRAIDAMFPLSSHVFLVRKRSGTWCLTDWHRFEPEWDDANSALGHRTAFRRLTFQERMD